VNPFHRQKMIDIFRGEPFRALKPRLKLVMTEFTLCARCSHRRSMMFRD